MTKVIHARTVLRPISALLIAAVLWRAGMSLDFKRIEKSRSSVSNEFLPIDEVVKLVDQEVASTGSVAYVVEDVSALDGLDRSTFAAVAFRILPRGQKGQSILPQVRQAKLGRTNSGRSYIVKKSTYD